MKRTAIAAILSALTVGAGLCGWPSQALAAPPDVTSPAGTTTGLVVIFTPVFGAAPGAVSSGSPVLPPLTGRFVPSPTTPGMAGPALPGILLLAPTPATGSLVVPAGPSFTQMQLVIPGPNPAQNTTIGLSQLLNVLLKSTGTAGGSVVGPPVSVFATPATP